MVPVVVCVVVLWAGVGCVENPVGDLSALDERDAGDAGDGRGTGVARDAGGEPGEPGAASADAGAVRDGDARVLVTGHVNGGLLQGPMTGSTRVCVYQRETGDEGECVETDAIGQFAIELPPHAEVALTFRHPLLTPTIRAFLTSDVPLELGNTRVANSAGLSGIAEALGYDDDPDKGALFFSGIEAVRADLPAGGDDIFYLNGAGTLIEGATSLSTRGTGGFMNVVPGETRVHFRHPNNACSFQTDNTFSGWPDAEEVDVARVPVLAGFHTSIVSMFCGSP